MGFIEACSGLPAPVTHVGGDLVALRGTITVKATSEGIEQILPSEVVGRQHVAAGADYHFTLPPGHYVIILPHYKGGNVGTDVSATVHAGTTITANLPNTCK